MIFLRQQRMGIGEQGDAQHSEQLANTNRPMLLRMVGLDLGRCLLVGSDHLVRPYSAKALGDRVKLPLPTLISEGRDACHHARATGGCATHAAAQRTAGIAPGGWSTS